MYLLAVAKYFQLIEIVCSQTSEAEAFLINLSEEIQRRLESVKMKGKKLTLKIMVRKAGAPIESAKFGGHGICDNIAR